MKFKKRFTKRELTLTCKGFEIVVPKGTECNNNTACGIDDQYYFVSDLSFIDRVKQGLLYHDATYYGIRVPESELSEASEL
jgi:hypothetical protein